MSRVLTQDWLVGPHTRKWGGKFQLLMLWELGNEVVVDANVDADPWDGPTCTEEAPSRAEGTHHPSPAFWFNTGHFLWDSHAWSCSHSLGQPVVGILPLWGMERSTCLWSVSRTPEWSSPRVRWVGVWGKDETEHSQSASHALGAAMSSLRHVVACHVDYLRLWQQHYSHSRQDGFLPAPFSWEIG